MDDKEKVIALYNYIAEVSKSFKDISSKFLIPHFFSFLLNKLQTDL